MVPLVAASAVAQSSGREFSDLERNQLRAGELVRREVTRREGRYSYVGGSSWQLVRAPLTEVWDLVTDPASYPRVIPSLAEAEVVVDGEDERVIRMEHRYSLVSAEYHARVRIDREQHRIRFDLDRSRPHDLHAGRGFLELTPYRGDTILAWGALADLGNGMMQQLFGPVLLEWMLRVPRCVRDEIEPGFQNHC